MPYPPHDVFVLLSLPYNFTITEGRSTRTVRLSTWRIILSVLSPIPRGTWETRKPGTSLGPSSCLLKILGKEINLKILKFIFNYFDILHIWVKSFFVQNLCIPPPCFVMKSLMMYFCLTSYTYERLMNQISSGNSMLTQSRIQHALNQRFGTPPPTWAGCTVEFVVKETLAHFSSLAVKTEVKQENFGRGGGGRGGRGGRGGNKRSEPFNSSPGIPRDFELFSIRIISQPLTYFLHLNEQVQ